MRQISTRYVYQPETSVKLTALLFFILFLVATLGYIAIVRRYAVIRTLGLLLVATVVTMLAATYFFYASYYVEFPADIFIWSESDFVNDIIKIRTGYPMYTAQIDNQGYGYVPGAQVMTYLIAWLVDNTDSIPAFRSIQVGFSVLSAIVASICCRLIISSAGSIKDNSDTQIVAGMTTFGTLFLIATNQLTNGFNHLLHHEALSQLLSVTGFCLLLWYNSTKSKLPLFLMVLMPLAGFWVKQSLGIWAALFTFYLIVFDRPFSLRKVIFFALPAFGLILISVGIAISVWGEPFTYWAFTVLGSHQVSPLRSFRHLLIIWPYFAVGLFGGAVLFRYVELRTFVGPWVVWLILISVETYTSGIAWMLNHIGPGSLIAGIWFVVAILFLAERMSMNATISDFGALRSIQAAISIAIVFLVFSGLGLIRIPVPPFSGDAYRYVGEIEKEVTAQPLERTLLDFGSWVYLDHGVVMKDRASPIGERGYSQTADFSGILARLEGKHYSKILVRNYHSGDFWYDHELWPDTSNIRMSLTRNYEEIRRIRAVQGLTPVEMPYGFNEISVLVPRP